MAAIWRALDEDDAQALNKALAFGHSPDDERANCSPLRAAVTRGRFDVALMLLDAGCSVPSYHAKKTADVARRFEEGKPGSPLWMRKEQFTDWDSNPNFLGIDKQKELDSFVSECLAWAAGQKADHRTCQIGSNENIIQFLNPHDNQPKDANIESLLMRACATTESSVSTGNKANCIAELALRIPDEALLVKQLVYYDPASDRGKMHDVASFRKAVSCIYHSGGPIFQLQTSDRPVLDKKHPYLHEAIDNGNDREAKALLYFGAPHTQMNRDGDLEIHRLESCDTLAFFLEREIDPNSRDWHNRTLLHRCAKADAVDLLDTLLSYKAQLSPKDSDGTTPLHVAISAGSHQAAHRLVDAGASLRAKDDVHREPLHELAAHRGNEEWARDMAQKIGGEGYIRARTRDELGRQPLHIAAANGGLKLLDQLAAVCNDDESMLFGELDGQDDFGMSPLAIAAKDGNVDCAVNLFRDHGAAAHSVDKAGKTPLHHACAAGLSELVLQIVKSVSSAELKRPNKHNETPVHVAARLGYHTCLQALISSAAGDERWLAEALERRGPSQVTPLMLAASRTHKACVESLVALSACKYRIDEADATGKTALHHGAGSKVVVLILLKAGANPLLEDSDGNTPLEHAQAADAEEAAKVLQEEQNPNAVTKSGIPKLLEAVGNGNRSSAEALLRRGANPDKKGEGSGFPLHEAASLACGSGDMVELLLEHKATVDKVDDDRKTPLYVACENANAEAVRALLSRNASTSKRDEAGRLPLHAAAFSGSVEITQALLNAGTALQRGSTTDDSGTTPLDLAASETVAQLLRE